MPLSRRALLRGTIVSAACLAWPAVSRSGDATWALPLLEDEFQSAEWSLAGPSEWATGDANGLIRLPEGGLALAGGSSGTYRSVAHQFPFRADGAGLLWALEGPADALTIRLRAGDDGRTWSDWQTARPLTHGPRDVTGVSELVGLSGRFWQIDIELRPMAEGRPVLRRVAVRAVGSRGPDIGQAAAAAATPIGALAGGGLGPPAPRIISRRDWGCPQPISSPAWPPEYRDAVKIFVHHTVTTNNDLNPPATVRAIWQYHAITLD
ncbi:MAG TPA: hypothetical protein VHL09_12410 [Dehalococcoidia bacterium]|nr:hypothetical protein [Dehalococcoidia bacterium]